MEKDREIKRLTNVLRRVARAALYAAWRGAAPDAARFCAAQYNRILARLRELEPAVEQLFAPVAADASPAVTRLAARELAAYFEEEEAAGEESACGPRAASRGRGSSRSVRVWSASRPACGWRAWGFK